MTTQAELADLIDRSPAAVSQATREEHLCAGYPIAEWAEFTASGRVAGYEIPPEVRAELHPRSTENRTQETFTRRANPSPRTHSDRESANPEENDGGSVHSLCEDVPNFTVPALRTDSPDDPPNPSVPTGSGEFSFSSLPLLATLGSQESGDGFSLDKNTVDEPTPSAPQVDASHIDASSHVDASSRTSLLPEGEDFFRPVASGGAAHAIAVACQEDTPTARALLMLAGLGGGALIGYHASGKNAGGAMLGGALGMWASHLGLTLPNSPPESTQMGVQPSGSTYQ